MEELGQWPTRRGANIPRGMLLLLPAKRWSLVRQSQQLNRLGFPYSVGHVLLSSMVCDGWRLISSPTESQEPAAQLRQEQQSVPSSLVARNKSQLLLCIAQTAASSGRLRAAAVRELPWKDLCAPGVNDLHSSRRLLTYLRAWWRNSGRWVRSLMSYAVRIAHRDNSAYWDASSLSPLISGASVTCAV
jgi:hypothetical protein